MLRIQTKSLRNMTNNSRVGSVIGSLIKTMLSINSKLLLLGLVLVTFDAGINQIRNSFMGSEVAFRQPEGSMLFKGALANLIDCNDLNIRKPPRFGKRNAYIDKYRSNTNCVDRQRRVFKETPKHAINSEDMNTLLAKLFWIFNVNESRRPNKVDPVGLLVQSSQQPQQQQPSLLDRLAEGGPSSGIEVSNADIVELIRQFQQQLTGLQYNDPKEFKDIQSVGDHLTNIASLVSSASSKDSSSPSSSHSSSINRPLSMEEMFPV